MAPFYDVVCQEGGPEAVECAVALVGVNVVRPRAARCGRSTLTPLARRRGVAAAGSAGVVFLAAGGGGSVGCAGPGSG